jgi:hypothetical protein
MAEADDRPVSLPDRQILLVFFKEGLRQAKFTIHTY